MESKTFTSIDSKSSIKTTIENDTIHFEIIEINYDNILPFMHILKDVCTYFTEKEIKKVIQTIMRNEFAFFKHSKIIYDDNRTDIIIIETPIDKFLDELTDVLGLDQIKL